MLASLPCMQWLVAPTPRRLPVAVTFTPVTPSCQAIRRPGVVTNSQTVCGGAGVAWRGISRTSLRIEDGPALRGWPGLDRSLST
jgi:hypothetical protein